MGGQGENPRFLARSWATGSHPAGPSSWFPNARKAYFRGCQAAIRLKTTVPLFRPATNVTGVQTFK